jgi:Zn finger protein HypA/HybF involved in hydrogenase expression
MHEFGVTETIITRLLNQLRREKIERVLSVRFQRSSAFSEQALRQTFDVISRDTPLAGARLFVDVLVVRATCNCGYSSEVNSEDLLGHMFVCPICGAIKEIAEAHDLELLEVVVETEEDLHVVHA